MKKLLYISKNFPPQVGGGIRRIDAVYHILKKIDFIETDTITAVQPDPAVYQGVRYISQLFFKDRSYQASISLKEVKSKIPLIDKALLGWLPHVIAKIVTKKYDFIYCTVPIFTNFIIGFIYKKLQFNRPDLIVEYRDMHSFNPEYQDNLIKKIIKFFEKWMLYNCRWVIVTTEGMKKILSCYIQPDKIIVIRNYISNNDLDKIKNIPAFKINEPYFHLGYVGTLNTGRSPEQILGLLKLSSNDKPVALHFVGTSDQQNQIISNMARTNGLTAGRLFFHGVVDRLTSLRFMKSFNGLILIINKNASIEQGYGIPGKLYDYVYLNNNIYADLSTYENLKNEFTEELEIIRTYDAFINFKLNDYHTLDEVFKQKVMPILTL